MTACLWSLMEPIHGGLLASSRSGSVSAQTHWLVSRDPREQKRHQAAMRHTIAHGRQHCCQVRPEDLCSQQASV